MAINPSDLTLLPADRRMLEGEKEPIDESPWPDTRVEPQLGRGTGTEVTLGWTRLAWTQGSPDPEPGVPPGAPDHALRQGPRSSSCFTRALVVKSGCHPSVVFPGWQDWAKPSTSTIQC